MSDLSNTVYDYYVAHFDELPQDKQFHFASRLYLWNQDDQCKRFLNELRPWFTHHGSPEAAVKQTIDYAKASPLHGSKNAAGLRRPHFEKYPLLKTYVSALFRITFLGTIYNIDAVDWFFKFFDIAHADATADRLVDDDDAVAILSTHAVNFLYLYNELVRGQEVDAAAILRLGQTYDLRDPVHLQLLIYLYTHCIIGESLFYYRPLPSERLGIYRDMVDELEGLIAENFAAVNLDNKFEFLVCAEMTGRPSSLREAIFEEAGKSLSGAGDFLIDRHNGNPQTDNVSLDKSEHRNVLFIMANRPYTPLWKSTAK